MKRLTRWNSRRLPYSTADPSHAKRPRPVRMRAGRVLWMHAMLCVLGWLVKCCAYSSCTPYLWQPQNRHLYEQRNTLHETPCMVFTGTPNLAEDAVEGHKKPQKNDERDAYGRESACITLDQ